MSKKTIIWIIIVLAVIAVLAAFLAGRNHQTQILPSVPVSSQPVPVTSPHAAVPEVQMVSSSQVPSGLPANIPWEQGVQIIQNFTSKDPSTGKTQSTRIYVSGKTLAQNFSIYQKYLSDNGWTLTNSVDQPTIKNLDASKGSARLDITIAQGDKKQVTVNVSIIQ